MKSLVLKVIPTQIGRSPCGERGLKLLGLDRACKCQQSLPVRGAWVEMVLAVLVFRDALSLPVRGAWVEMVHIM